MNENACWDEMVAHAVAKIRAEGWSSVTLTPAIISTAVTFFAETKQPEPDWTILLSALVRLAALARVEASNTGLISRTINEVLSCRRQGNGQK